MPLPPVLAPEDELNQWLALRQQRRAASPTPSADSGAAPTPPLTGGRPSLAQQIRDMTPPPSTVAPTIASSPRLDTPGASVAPPANGSGRDLTSFGVSQTGDPTISRDEALALCGPAAAVMFANFMGRNPTLSEAWDMAAKAKLWTPGGMGGPESQQKLLSLMGVPTKLENGVNWNRVQQEVDGGNPVIVSSPGSDGHYWQILGYRASDGKYFVGPSGSVYRGGSEWLSPEQMGQLSTTPDATLYIDHPDPDTAPSVAQRSPSRDDLVAYAQGAARRNGIDPALYVNQIDEESGFNPKAGSPAGAQGVAQIVPKFHPGVDTSNPFQSLDYAAALMAGYLKQYGGDYPTALAAYNAGPGAVAKYGGPPPFEETQRYIKDIMGDRPSPQLQPPSNVSVSPNLAQLSATAAAQAATVAPLPGRTPSTGGVPTYSPPAPKPLPPIVGPVSTYNPITRVDAASADRGNFPLMNSATATGDADRGIGLGPAQPYVDAASADRGNFPLLGATPPVAPPSPAVSPSPTPPTSIVPNATPVTPSSSPSFFDNVGGAVRGGLDAVGGAIRPVADNIGRIMDQVDQARGAPPKLGSPEWVDAMNAQEADIKRRATAAGISPAEQQSRDLVGGAVNPVNWVVGQNGLLGNSGLNPGVDLPGEVSRGARIAAEQVAPGLKEMNEGNRIGPVDVAEGVLRSVPGVNASMVRTAAGMAVPGLEAFNREHGGVGPMDIAEQAVAGAVPIPGLAEAGAAGHAASSVGRELESIAQREALAVARADAARQAGDIGAEVLARREADALRSVVPSQNELASRFAAGEVPERAPAPPRPVDVPPNAPEPLLRPVPPRETTGPSFGGDNPSSVGIPRPSAPEEGTTVPLPAAARSPISPAEAAFIADNLSGLQRQEYRGLRARGFDHSQASEMVKRGVPPLPERAAPSEVAPSVSPEVAPPTFQLPAKTPAWQLTPIQYLQSEMPDPPVMRVGMDRNVFNAEVHRQHEIYGPEWRRDTLLQHEAEVRMALGRGDPVPPEVLAAYPRIKPAISTEVSPTRTAPLEPVQPAAGPTADLFGNPVAPRTDAHGDPIGTTTWARGVVDPRMRYQFQHKLVELDDLIPSHTDSFTEHPAYPPELQPRDRSRISNREQVNRIAAGLRPDEVMADTNQLVHGSPIVGPDNLVESGNGRVLALRKARADIPANWDAYRQELHDHAQEYGFTPEQVDAMKDPVLVRERTTPLTDEQRPLFAKEANKDTVAPMSSFENAKGDRALITDSSLAMLHITDNETIDESLLKAKNNDFVQRFLQGFPADEGNNLVDADGLLNLDGLRRIKAAMFARTYPTAAGQHLLRLFTEVADTQMKTVESAMFASLPQVSRMEALIRNGERSPSLDLTNDWTKALDVFARLKQNNETVAGYLGQHSMFDRELTPFQETLLETIDHDSRSPARMRRFLQGYAHEVESSPDIRQRDFEGKPPAVPTREEIVDRLTTNYNPDANATGLFATAPEEAAAPLTERSNAAPRPNGTDAAPEPTGSVPVGAPGEVGSPTPYGAGAEATNTNLSRNVGGGSTSVPYGDSPETNPTATNRPEPGQRTYTDAPPDDLLAEIDRLRAENARLKGEPEPAPLATSAPAGPTDLNNPPDLVVPQRIEPGKPLITEHLVGTGWHDLPLDMQQAMDQNWLDHGQKPETISWNETLNVAARRVQEDPLELAQKWQDAPRGEATGQIAKAMGYLNSLDLEAAKLRTSIDHGTATAIDLSRFDAVNYERMMMMLGIRRQVGEAGRALNFMRMGKTIELANLAEYQYTQIQRVAREAERGVQKIAAGGELDGPTIEKLKALQRSLEREVDGRGAGDGVNVDALDQLGNQPLPDRNPKRGGRGQGGEGATQRNRQLSQRDEQDLRTVAPDLGVQLVQMNRRQNALRDRGDLEGAAALEPERQDLLQQIYDQITEQVQKNLERQKPQLTPEEMQLEVDQRMARGITGRIRANIVAELRGGDPMIARMMENFDVRVSKATAKEQVAEVERLVKLAPNHPGIREWADQKFTALAADSGFADVEARAARERIAKLDETHAANLARQQQGAVDRAAVQAGGAAPPSSRPLDEQAGIAGRLSQGLDKKIDVALAKETVARIDALLKASPDSRTVRTLASDLLSQLETTSGYAEQVARNYRERVAKANLRRIFPGNPDAITPEMIEEASRLDMSDPRAFTRLSEILAAQPSLWSQLGAVRVASLLSGPSTHMVNTIGNAILTAYGPVSRVAAATGEQAVTLGGSRRATAAQYSNVGAELHGMLGSFRAALADARQTFETGISSNSFRDLSTQRANPIRIPVLSPLNGVFRFLGASDDFFRTLNRGGAIMAEADRLAQRSGQSLDEVLLNITDHPEVIARGANEARRRTLQAEMPTLGKAVNLARAAPAVHFLIPFFNTNMNVMRVGADLSPIGFARTFRAARDPELIKQGTNLAAAADARGDAMLGSMAMTTAAILTGAGVLSGFGPLDSRQRNALAETGWKPFSVKIGDQWIPYQNVLGPMALPMAMGATVTEALKNGMDAGKAEVALGTMLHNGGQYFLSQSGLKGMMDFMNLIFTNQPTDQTSSAEQWVEGTATSVIPYGGLLGTLARATDPNIRNPDNAIQAILARLPGLSRLVPESIDRWGEARVRSAEGPLAGTPISAMSQEKHDPVRQEVLRLQQRGFQVAPDYLPSNQDVHAESVKLTSAERQKGQILAGQAAHGQIAAMMATPDWALAPDSVRAKAIDEVVKRSREYAHAVLLPAVGHRAYQQFVEKNQKLGGAR